MTQNLELRGTKPSGCAPAILCAALPAFDRTELDSVRRAFQSATPCPLEQAWLDGPAAGFSPALARTGWRGRSLMVFVELTDLDIFNDATQLNQRTWELGDVFEMFFQLAGRENYVEFHVTPHNHRLQLHYPDGGAVERARSSGKLDDFLVAGEAFHSTVWVEKQMDRWFVHAEIPSLAVCGLNEPIEDTQWRFSFGRYDHTRGVREPVISSTSPHAKPDFHRRHEWGMMTFKKSPAIPIQ